MAEAELCLVRCYANWFFCIIVVRLRRQVLPLDFAVTAGTSIVLLTGISAVVPLRFCCNGDLRLLPQSVKNLLRFLF